MCSAGLSGFCQTRRWTDAHTGHTHWTDTLDGPHTHWTDTLDGHTGRTHWTDHTHTGRTTHTLDKPHTLEGPHTYTRPTVGCSLICLCFLYFDEAVVHHGRLSHTIISNLGPSSIRTVQMALAAIEEVDKLQYIQYTTHIYMGHTHVTHTYDTHICDTHIYDTHIYDTQI